MDVTRSNSKPEKSYLRRLMRVRLEAVMLGFVPQSNLPQAEDES